MDRFRLFEIIEVGDAADRASRIFDGTLATIILLNGLAIVLESYDHLSARYGDWCFAFEVTSIALFSAEYAMRIYTADLIYTELGPVRSRLRWIFSFSGLIDLLAILPFFVPMFIAFDLRFLRMIRILRLLRVFKLHRYSRAFQMIGQIVSEEKEELLTTLFISGVLMIIASTFMYYLERDAQPDSFPNVLATLWWAVATLTTVGYGDVVPMTSAGKVFAGIISLIGIGVVALPTGILSAAFMEKMRARKEAGDDLCPHCGKTIGSKHP